MKSLLLVLLLGMVLSDKCGGNCPGGRCPNCPCGTSPNRVDVASKCKMHSWTQKCCVCVVNAESGGNGNAMNYNGNGTFDVGLFQINKVNWGGCSGGSPPCDVSTNVRCAIMVYKGSRNTWNPWSVAGKCGCRNSP